MTIWIIEPHDPLIVRDGRPFGPNPGVQATSLTFPFPSTTTGGVRTRAGLNSTGVFDRGKIEQVKKIKVRGPLLVELKSDSNEGELENWLVPAPNDALLFADEEEIEVKRLLPLDVSSEAQIDLTAQNSDELLWVGLSKQDVQKPAKNAPLYWYWHTFQDWLLDPSLYERGKIQLSKLGHNGPQRERRIHVSIDANRLVGKDGALFGTSGLEFTYSEQHNPGKAKRLALAMSVENGTGLTMQAGLTSFGGERRIVSWQKSNSELPLCPKELIAAIIEQKACRVLLLTPAYFQLGYHPTWLLEQKNGVKSRLRAIAIQRPQVVSGWDLEHGKPKPTRRLAPAGTVLFLSLEGSDEAIGNWIKEKWMQCVSDDEPSRNDGFGLAAIGTWSGMPEKMQEEG